MRRTRILTGILIGLLLAGAAVGNEASDKLIQRGDRFYGNRGKGRQYCVKAVEFYEKALAVDAESVAASWKLARASYWLGVHTDGDEAKLAIYKKGIDIAKRAISLDAKSVESHFWLGVSYGKYGETKGVMNSLALVDPIKKEMQTVLELDEKFEGGGAHRVLGRLYHKLPGIAGGSTEKSIEHLEKAIAIDDSRLLNHLFIAEVYVAEKDTANAKKHLQKIIDAPVEDGREPENAEEKARAKEMLAELE
jgi:tetratricopeptide (TPR) repeat protein